MIPIGINSIGNKTIQFIGATKVQGTETASLSISVPAGAQSGDFLMLIAANKNNAMVSGPSGFNLELEFGPELACYVYHRFITTIPTVTFDFGTNAQNHEGSGILLCFRNVKSTSPIDTSATDTFISGRPDCPSITTSGTGRMIVAIGWLADDADGLSSLSGYTIPTNGTVSPTSGGSSTHTIAIGYLLQSAAGSIDPATFGGTGNDGWCAATFALRPA